VTNGVDLLAKWHQSKYIYMTQDIVADSFEGNSVFMQSGGTKVSRTGMVRTQFAASHLHHRWKGTQRMLNRNFGMIRTPIVKELFPAMRGNKGHRCRAPVSIWLPSRRAEINEVMRRE
jgi:hypothetical protein